MIIRAMAARQTDTRLVGPVVSFSESGRKLIVAQADVVANCSALQFDYISPDSTLEEGAAVLAVTTAIAVFTGDDRAVPFVPFGRAYDQARECARMIGFDDQTATVIQRLDLYGYQRAPAGATVANLTEPLPFAALTLKLGDQVDIPLLQYRWARAYLQMLASGGVPIQERPPSPNWIN